MRGMGSATGRAELIVDARCELGEGPLWHPGAGRLFWVDIDGRSLHWHDPASGSSGWWRLERRPGCLAVADDGGLVIGDEMGVQRVAPDDLSSVPADRVLPTSPIVAVEADRPQARMNDGRVDPWGRFWFGTMAEGVPAAGTLYRLDAAGAIDAVVSGVSVSNGIDWSPDRQTMYYVDTATQRVDRFDVTDDGSIESRRTFVTIEEDEGSPDGLVVDAGGGVWVGLWGGGEVRRHAPDGTVTHRIAAPVSQVTSIAFGGPALEDLYITSARAGLTADGLRREPAGGGLFHCRPGLAGRPPTPFRAAAAVSR